MPDKNRLANTVSHASDSSTTGTLKERVAQYQMAEAVHLSEKAVRLYKGRFLPADAEQMWTMPYRERLQNKFRRLIVKLGRCSMMVEQWEKAADYFQKGIEVDGLAEEFYWHLLLCYRHLDRKAEAVKTYQRCRTTLASSLGITPSACVEEMYNYITHNTGNNSAYRKDAKENP